jgi:hypothetical protein
MYDAMQSYIVSSIIALTISLLLFFSALTALALLTLACCITKSISFCSTPDSSTYNKIKAHVIIQLANYRSPPTHFVLVLRLFFLVGRGTVLLGFLCGGR